MERVRSFLRQGVTPEKLALCLTLGVILSCCPVLGLTTTLCTIAALTLKLNLPAIQLANYAAAPLQILLYLPFIRAGEWIFRSEPLPLSLIQIKERFQTSPWRAIQSLWSWEWHAVIAWALLSTPVMLLLHLLLKKILRKMETASDQAKAASSEG